MSVNIVEFPETKIMNFSAGEGHVELCKEAIKFLTYRHKPWININCDFDNDGDLFKIAFLVNAARGINKNTHVILKIPYFPYARQDRFTTLGSAFSLKVVADFINSLGINKVLIKDPHSVVVTTILNNCEIISSDYSKIDDLVRSNPFREKFIVVSPDAGAVKRSKAIAEKFDLRFAIADKKRNPATGQILSTEIFGKIEAGDQIIVVDDICDGGRTFIELAKSIRKENYVTMHLFVTFGIFSKGKDVLYEHFETVSAEHEYWS